jgi:hypothetical protein
MQLFLSCVIKRQQRLSLENYGYIARLPLVSQAIGFACPFKWQTVGDSFLGMQIPARESFHQFCHVAQTGDPRSVQSYLWMDKRWRNIKLYVVSLPNKRTSSPLARSFQRQQTCRSGSRAVYAQLRNPCQP